MGSGCGGFPRPRWSLSNYGIESCADFHEVLASSIASLFDLVCAKDCGNVGTVMKGGQMFIVGNVIVSSAPVGIHDLCNESYLLGKVSYASGAGWCAVLIDNLYVDVPSLLSCLHFFIVYGLFVSKDSSWIAKE